MSAAEHDPSRLVPTYNSTLPVPVTTVHDCSYYIPPGELVRELGPYDQPSLGMIPLYAQTEVRTFEAAAFYDADMRINRDASNRHQTASSQTSETSSSSSTSSSITSRPHRRTASCKNCIKCDKGAHGRHGDGRHGDGRHGKRDGPCQCTDDASPSRRNFCDCPDCREGNCYRCAGARRSDSTLEDRSGGYRRHGETYKGDRDRKGDRDLSRGARDSNADGDAHRRGVSSRHKNGAHGHKDGRDHGDGRHGDGRHGDGRHGDGRHGDGRHGDGRHGDGRHGDGRHGDGRHGEERHGDGRHGEERHGDGRHGEERRGRGASGRSCRVCGLNKNEPACGRCGDCRANGCRLVRDCLANNCGCVGRRARSSDLSHRGDDRRGRTASTETPPRRRDFGRRRDTDTDDEGLILVFGKRVSQRNLSPRQRADLIRSLKAGIQDEQAGDGRHGDGRHGDERRTRGAKSRGDPRHSGDGRHASSQPDGDMHSRGRLASPQPVSKVHSTPTPQRAHSSGRNDPASKTPGTGGSRKNASIHHRETSLPARRSGPNSNVSPGMQVTHRSGPDGEGKPLTTHHYFHFYPDLPSRKMNSFAPPMATSVHRLNESGLEADVEAIQYYPRDVSGTLGSRMSKARGVIGDHLRINTCEMESSIESIGVH